MESKGNSNYIINYNENNVLKIPIKKVNLKKNFEEFNNHKRIYDLWLKNNKLFNILYIPETSEPDI